ncbi:hypothetical protein GIB67_007180 [Kingdonia uniflora]|uniref:peptidylprolyl isomerase n=1 Tax=Kingdonia uniflora TaxID=39325 RepID=A0A7J7NDF3_9MAGN|nr:hypothetical protein GIB67_007180 [Kingdonia uniflora]
MGVASKLLLRKMRHLTVIRRCGENTYEIDLRRNRSKVINVKLLSHYHGQGSSPLPISPIPGICYRDDIDEILDQKVDNLGVAIHYYGRLAAKQGWRFDSTYDHKDEMGVPIPFSFVLGSGKVIAGIEATVKSMKVGDIRRVIIPPTQGYQNMSQEPIPPDFFDRQRLFTTIFNPTRLANGEGSTLGTLIFDIELVSVRHL